MKLGEGRYVVRVGDAIYGRANTVSVLDKDKAIATAQVDPRKLAQ